MRFDNAFDVQAPIGQVWTAMLDVERVAPCIPGAEVLEQVSPSSYRVGIKIRIGPIVQQYRGEIEIVESDESTHHAVMQARARETRGQGRAEATVDLRLTEEGTRTHGDMAADVALSGPAAAMGRGIIQDVSSRIVEDFSKNLAAMLAGGPAAPTAEAPTLATTTAAPPEEGRRSEAATAAPAAAAHAGEEPGAEEPPSAGPLPEAVPELHTPEAPTPVAPPPAGPLPEVAAPDAPTMELPIPSGPPDTAPPPLSGLTGGPPAGPAEEAALGRPGAEEPVAGPAAAAATGGPSAEKTARPPESPRPAPPPEAAAPEPSPPPEGAAPEPEPPRVAPPPPRAQPAPAATEAALPVLSILGDVALKRLREPKLIAGLMAALILLVFLRSRRGRP